MKLCTLTWTLTLAFALSHHTAQGALTWRPGEGWSYEGVNTPAKEGNSRAQLELGRRLEARQDWNNALAAYSALVRTWPFSFNSGEAQFKVGWCAEQLADFQRAFKAYQKCVEKYPNSDFFERALERQFAIGNLYLAGEPQRLWKIPLLPSMEKTVDMYEQVIKNAPYGKFAPQAQFKIGLAYEKQKKWAEAVRAYNRILDRYPGNDIVDDAQYQIGYAWFLASQTADYDQGAGQKAIDSFQEFIDRFPSSEKVTQARENIAKLEGRSVTGAFNIAKFYEGQRQIEAAIIYYNDVIRQGPDSPEAEIAREKIEELTPLKEAGPKLPKTAKNETASPAPRATPGSTNSSDLATSNGPGGTTPASDLPEYQPIDPELAKRNRPETLGSIQPPMAPAGPQVSDQSLAALRARDAEISARQAERAAQAAEARAQRLEEQARRQAGLAPVAPPETPASAPASLEVEDVVTPQDDAVIGPPMPGGLAVDTAPPDAFPAVDTANR